jgi:hypothetical protein
MELILLGLFIVALILYHVSYEDRIFLAAVAVGTWLHGHTKYSYIKNGNNGLQGKIGKILNVALPPEWALPWWWGLGCCALVVLLKLLSPIMHESVRIWVTITWGLIIGVFGYGPSYYDKSEMTGNRAWLWLRTARGWKHMARFFQHSVRNVNVTNNICSFGDSQTVGAYRAGVPRLYACRPHGIWSLYVFFNFMVIGDGISDRIVVSFDKSEKKKPKDAKEKSRNVKVRKSTRAADAKELIFVGVHSLLLAIPIVREFMLWMGAIDVSWQAISHQLTRTDAVCHVAIIPEGVRGIGKPIGDSTRPLHVPPSVHLPSWHSKQWGFLRRLFHMEIDIDIVPVICPREVSLCRIWTGEWSWITYVRKATANSKLRYPFPTFFLGPLPQASYVTWHGPVFTKQARESLESFCTRYQHLEEVLWNNWQRVWNTYLRPEQS